MTFQRHLTAATTSLAGALIALSQGPREVCGGGSIPPYGFQTAGEHEKKSLARRLHSPTYYMAYATPGVQARRYPSTTMYSGLWSVFVSPHIVFDILLTMLWNATRKRAVL